MPRESPPFRLKPDHFAILAFLLALLGEMVLPFGLLPPAAIGSVVSWSGAGVMLAGLGLEIIAAQAMKQVGTTTIPYARPAALVTAGPFRLSRNPFYLGILLVVGGLMLMLSLDWLILVIPLLWLALDRFVVPHEEAALHAAFGPDWLGYAGRVRRWL